MKKMISLLFLLCLITSTLFAQKKITGKVTSEDNSPVPYLTVVEEGTTNGTITDFDGNYSIEVSATAEKLIFSFIGMETQVVEISGKTTINVIMKDDSYTLDEIIVSGIRANLIKAQKIKRMAPSVVDAITSEEIGQFADESIGDAIQRIPGVQLERNDGETDGDRVSVRGIGSQFVRTTINGRSPMSAGTEGTRNLREFNLNVIPSEVINGVTVYKSPTANILESGIGGSVDMKTIRPLNLKYDKNIMAKLNIKGIYQTQAKEIDSRYSGIVAGKNKNSTFGYYASGIYSKTNSHTDQITVNTKLYDVNLDDNGDGVSDRTVEDVRIPTSPVLNPIRGDINRIGFAGGVQFKPNDRWDIYIDGLYSNYETSSVRQSFRFNLTRMSQNVLDANKSIIDENNVLQYVDGSGITGGNNFINFAQLQPLKFVNTTATQIYGTNAAWHNDAGLRIIGDLSYSNVDFLQLLSNPKYRALKIPKAGITYDARTRIPSINLPDEAFDLSSWTDYGWNTRELDFYAESYAFNLDFIQDLNKGILQSLTWGANYATSSLDSKTRAFSDKTEPLIMAGLDGSLTDFNFLEDENFSIPKWLSTDYDAAADAFPALREMLGDDLTSNSGASFILDEAILSFYGQLNLESKIMTGNIGLRATNTQFETSGIAKRTYYESDGTKIQDEHPVSTESEYWTLLPTMNLNFAVTEDFKLRVGVAKTLSRPRQRDLVPIITLSEDDPTDPDADGIGTAKAGNENLDPYTAWNYDLTAEYYTPNLGAFAVSLFYKDISNFIINQLTEETTVPGSDGLFNVTQPVNFSDATVIGAEMGFHQPFTFLPSPFDGLGLRFNYTIVDSEFAEDVGSIGAGFPSVSKHNINSMLYYEKYGFAVRVSYNYRSNYLRQIGGQGAQTSSDRFTEGQNLWSANASYKFKKYFRVFFNGFNLTGDDRRDYVGNESTFLSYFSRSPSFQFGLGIEL